MSWTPPPGSGKRELKFDEATEVKTHQPSLRLDTLQDLLVPHPPFGNTQEEMMDLFQWLSSMQCRLERYQLLSKVDAYVVQRYFFEELGSQPIYF